jgi:hypothetical protein
MAEGHIHARDSVGLPKQPAAGERQRGEPLHSPSLPGLSRQSTQCRRIPWTIGVKPGDDDGMGREPRPKSGLDKSETPRYLPAMIRSAATFYWYFSYPLPAEAIARVS